MRGGILWPEVAPFAGADRLDRSVVRREPPVGLPPMGRLDNRRNNRGFGLGAHQEKPLAWAAAATLAWQQIRLASSGVAARLVSLAGVLSYEMFQAKWRLGVAAGKSPLVWPTFYSRLTVPPMHLLGLAKRVRVGSLASERQSVKGRHSGQLAR